MNMHISSKWSANIGMGELYHFSTLNMKKPKSATQNGIVQLSKKTDVGATQS